MNFACPLGLLQTVVIILSIVTSQHKVECKTTLSKLQYINAIRDVIEGLIKSLATRQKIEMNRRLELHEFRKHHEHRLGKDVLVCRLCKEIFVDPDKYFDHAHFHVVEKLKLSQSTDSNLRCKLCEDSFVNQFDLYKHCYEHHLLHNLDKLTTKAAETTTPMPNYAEQLYCKICNTTLMYPERFYAHSFQHLQDNMDLILNTTVHENTKNSNGGALEKYDRRASQEDRTLFNNKDGNCKRGNAITTELPGKLTICLSSKKSENSSGKSQNTGFYSRFNRNFTKIKISKMRDTTVAFDGSNRIRNVRNSSYTEKQKWKYNILKRFINVTNEGLKELILQDLHVNINKTKDFLKQTKAEDSKIATQTKITFEPEMVQHIKQAALWFQQKERKRDPDAKMVVIAKLDKKAYLQHVLTKQQRKLVSLERFLDRNSSDIYRYVVVNNSIVDRTSAVNITRPANRHKNTLPLCFITEPPRQRYAPRSFKYTNYNRSLRVRFNTSYHFSTNMNKNFIYANKTCKNILNGTNSMNKNTTRALGLRASFYIQKPKKVYGVYHNSTSYFNKNLYKNMYLSNNNESTININSYNMNRTIITNPKRRWINQTNTKVNYSRSSYFNKNLYKNRYLSNNNESTINNNSYNMNRAIITNPKRRWISQTNSKVNYNRSSYFNKNLYKNMYLSNNNESTINNNSYNMNGAIITNPKRRWISQTNSKVNYTRSSYFNKNLYLNMLTTKSELEWNYFCPVSQKYYTRKCRLFNRNLYKYQNRTSEIFENTSDKFTHSQIYNQNAGVTLKRRKRNLIYKSLYKILEEGVVMDISNAKRNHFHHLESSDTHYRQKDHKRLKRQVSPTDPAADELNLRTSLPAQSQSQNVNVKSSTSELKTTYPNETTTGWTNLYSTASRMVERIFRTQVRIVRITKDLRTTKKITLKPYAGAEEFTGDSFQGQSGEDRYERILKKMRSNQIYLKCPFCPLRFYYNPELMSHINVQHKWAGNYNESTFDVLFKTFPAHQTKHWNHSFENFAENFPTFDYEYPTRPTPPRQSGPTTKTTIDLARFSQMMENLLKPDYLQGFLTTAASTRNIDYLHRARTFATTKAQMFQVEGALRDARDYLRKLAATMLDPEDYQQIATTETITRSSRNEATHREVEANVGEIKRSRESTQGVVIEEVATDETTLSKKEVLQMGMKVVEDQLHFLKNKDMLSTVVNKLESTTHNRSIRTSRYSERFRIFKDNLGEKNRSVNQILEQIKSGLFKSRMEQFSSTRNEPTLRILDGVSAKSAVTDETTSLSDKYVPKRIRKRTTVAYARLYRTEINVTEDEHINKMLEILRRTRPVENYYRYVFDYKRRLGPTEMSYEDSDSNKQNATTMSTMAEQKLHTENFANFIASLKSIKTSVSPHDLTTQPHYAKFLRKLADLKAEEKRRREKAKADYDEQLKRMEAKIDERSTPLFINVNDMMKYRCEDEQRNKKVADTFKFILKNDIRETYWNATKDQLNVTETYDDGYGELDYETMTQYVYDPRDHRVFQNVPPTKTSKFVTHIPTAVKKSKSTAPPSQRLF